jgi:hypothetical protein
MSPAANCGPPLRTGVNDPRAIASTALVVNAKVGTGRLRAAGAGVISRLAGA